MLIVFTCTAQNTREYGVCHFMTNNMFQSMHRKSIVCYCVSFSSQLKEIVREHIYVETCCDPILVRVSVILPWVLVSIDVCLLYWPHAKS